MKQLLLQYGWANKGACNCSGVHTDKFSLETIDGTFNIKLRSSNFLISKPNGKYFRYSLKELKPILDEIKANHRLVNAVA